MEENQFQKATRLKERIEMLEKGIDSLEGREGFVKIPSLKSRVSIFPFRESSYPVILPKSFNKGIVDLLKIELEKLKKEFETL